MHLLTLLGVLWAAEREQVIGKELSETLSFLANLALTVVTNLHKERRQCGGWESATLTPLH